MAEGGEADLVADLMSKPFSRRTFQEKPFITDVSGHQKELLVDLKLNYKLYDRVIQLFVGKGWTLTLSERELVSCVLQ